MQYPHPQRINYRLITKLFAELDQMQDKRLKKEIVKKYLAKPNTSKPNHAVLGYVVDDTKKTVETLLKEYGSNPVVYLGSFSNGCLVSDYMSYLEQFSMDTNNMQFKSTQQKRVVIGVVNETTNYELLEQLNEKVQTATKHGLNDSFIFVVDKKNYMMRE